MIASAPHSLVLLLLLVGCGGEFDAPPAVATALSAAGAAGNSNAGQAGGSGRPAGAPGVGGAGASGLGGATSGQSGAPVEGGKGGASGEGGKAGATVWTCAPTPGSGMCAPCATKHCCTEIMACYTEATCMLADLAYDQCQLHGEDPCLPLLDAGGPLGEALRACKAEHCPKCN